MNPISPKQAYFSSSSNIGVKTDISNETEATSYSYPSHLSQGLNDLREENQLCDIIVNIGGTAFNAHRAVLAASSSYFKAMFTSGFKESSEKEINIDGNPDVFKVLLHFAYTGTLTMPTNTVFDVLDMACYMQFIHVYKTCAMIIERCLNASSKINQIPLGDVFKIYLLAKNHDHFEQLVKTAEKFLENNVQELKRSDVFLQTASVSFLEDFLSREELASASDEKQVLELVINWLKLDWDTRCTHAFSLLTKVRLGLVTPQQLTELVTKDILDIPECKALIDEVLQKKTSNQSATTLSLKLPQLFATRSTITAPISPYVRDNTLGLSVSAFQYYDIKQHRWKQLKRFASLPSSSYQSIIVVHGRLYAAGGLDQHQELDTDELFHDSDSDWDDDYEDEVNFRSVPVCQNHFFRYHSVENRWTRLPAMNVARNSFPMVHLRGYIYAIGGSNESGIEMSDVERFDRSKKEWEILPPLPVRCRSISAVAFKGKIIVHGITSAVNNPDTSQPQVKYVLLVYHPNSKYWQTAHSEVHEINVINRRPGKPPHLYVHTSICYRVCYVQVQSDTVTWICAPNHKPVVHELEILSQFNADSASTSTSEVDAVSVKVGESISQDHIPENTLGAFRISDEVFVSVNGFTYNTGISINSDQSRDVNINPFYSFNDSREQEAITSFTFDRKKLEH